MKKRWLWLLIAGFFTVVIIVTSSIAYAATEGELEEYCEEAGGKFYDFGDVVFCCYADEPDVCLVFDCSAIECESLDMVVDPDPPTPPRPPVIMQPGMQGDFRPTRPTAPATPHATPPATPEAPTQPTQIQPATPQAPTSGEPAGTGPAKPPAVQPQPKAVQPGSPQPVVK